MIHQGLSIGSLGKSQTKYVNVSDIHFDRITVDGGLYAARLKSWVGGQGLVDNVSWTNFKIHNVTFPVFITQVRGHCTTIGSHLIFNRS